MGQRNTCIETLGWCFVVERLSRSFVELSCDGAQLCLAMYRQIRALWEVLSQQAVGIFICTALPRRMWFAQKDVDIRGQGELWCPAISVPRSQVSER